VAGLAGFFPALLSPRRRIDVALHAVVMQAYVEGVSTRRVDDLVIAMGGTGISKSEVSRICAQLDTDVASWRTRPFHHIAFPYVFLDATYCKVRLNKRIVSQAVVIATGVSADGRREVLGCQVGDSETEAFWTEFLRELKDRGLGSLQLVISDAHSGLIKAISTTMQGASWQCCRVHFMRNALARVSKGHAEMVAATIRTIFAQPGRAEVRAQVDKVADMLLAAVGAVRPGLADAVVSMCRMGPTRGGSTGGSRRVLGHRQEGRDQRPRRAAARRRADRARPASRGKDDAALRARTHAAPPRSRPSTEPQITVFEADQGARSRDGGAAERAASTLVRACAGQCGAAGVTRTSQHPSAGVSAVRPGYGPPPLAAPPP